MSGAPEREYALRGGRKTHGIVRVGDTVRRPPTPNSDFVRRLLDHLRAAGFDAAPRALGTDEHGRDVLDFIPGDVPDALSSHSDRVLSSAARLVRRFHDATAALVDGPHARRVGLEVVCHNDLSPCNFVFVGGLPVAIIDFDAASPGTRLQDIAYAAWLWLDLGLPEMAPAEQGRRLSLFLRAYGPRRATRAEIVHAIVTRQTIVVARGKQTGDPAMSAWADACREWTIHNRAALEANR